MKLVPVQKATVGLKRLIDCLTYPFGSISMVNHQKLAQEITLADPKHTFCYVDWSNKYHPTLWTAKAWVDELKRRQEINRLSKRPKAKKIRIGRK